MDNAVRGFFSLAVLFAAIGLAIPIGVLIVLAVAVGRNI